MNQEPLLPPGVLRRSALVRSAAYHAAMVGVLLASNSVTRRTQHPFAGNMHSLAFPAVVAITAGFTRLNPAECADWAQQPTAGDIRELLGGSVLGAAACLSMLGIAAARGWVSAPAWGWEGDPTIPEVLAAMGWNSASTALLVSNEELIFRGYGLDTLRSAFGTAGAVAISVLLFARYHGPGAKQLLGLSLAGLFLSFLRLGSGKLWLGWGFHFGWNLVQQAVLGPADGPPSLRPLQLHGPPAWIGRPGHPEPGWLQILANAALAVGAGRWWWRTYKE
jgi:membrane protease YdiL (CAAX protease family)